MNRRTGSTLDDYLTEEGILEEVSAKAHKRLFVLQLADIMEESKMSKDDSPHRLQTSRKRVDRLLDPEYVNDVGGQLILAIEESAQEKAARRFFEESLHLMVTRIPSTASKTPDFFVDGETPGYVVEVKSRFDDEDFLGELRQGSTAVRSRAIGHARWTEDTARSARKQMVSGDSARKRFRVLWLAVECLSSTEAMFEQVIGTLYGVRQVAYWDEVTQQNAGRECLFAISGVFERWPDIDCAIITVGDSITLCINEFSEKAASFQASALYQSFARRGGPVSPSDLQANRGFLSIGDRTIDRTNEDAVRHYLSQRYNLKGVTILNIKAYSASVLVPRHEG